MMAQRSANPPRWYRASIDPRLSPDKRAAGDLTGSVAIIDACRPFHWMNSYPKVTGISAELREATLRRWGSQLQRRESATKTS